MIALLTSFLLIALAEMGDKTQLLTLYLASRFPVRKVLVGIALWGGNILGERLPKRTISKVSGALFLLFGLLTLAPLAF